MSDREEDILYTIALAQIPAVGCVAAQRLLTVCGNAKQIFKEKTNQLLLIERISPTIAHNINTFKTAAVQNAEKELKFIEGEQISVFLRTDDNFPIRLKNCVDSPILLYGKGNMNLNPKHSISIVGTRRLTDYGNKITQKIVEDLSTYEDIQIISGLAAGIDAAAHSSAVKYNMSTVGVLGHGLKTLYPANNRKLALSMLEKGGMLTEFMSDTQAEPHNFPRRNRIIAGLSDAVVVVEAHKRGGALITANIGFSYDRDVFTVPGRIGDRASEGCNDLIKFNKAALIASGHDIVEMMLWDNKRISASPKEKQKKLPLNLNNEEQLIIEAISQNETLDIDELSIITDLNINTLSKTLLSLEFEGYIVCLPGKRYRME
ncbi:MAG: DNA-processing protein DprA [Lentimicrobiaceae bacterium]|nr:DNA-processing protein DprA [Lentimicrobiaceae bacterium]